MKILNTQQIREADNFTILNEPIESILLMERAANQFVHAFINDFGTTSSIIHIFCGTGNNGGDGLAVARLLYNQGYSIKVYTLTSHSSPDYLINLDKLDNLNPELAQPIINIKDLPEPSASDIIIDALLGTGLNRPLSGKTKDLIIFLNKTNCTKISIDIPTGLFADQANTEGDIIFKPDIVYTFQAPKLSFLLPENESFVREFKVLDIGLAKNYLKEVESKNTYIEQSDIKNQLLQRTKFTHKGTYGHSLIIAGSYGKTGAALLASKANLRAGSGMLTTHVPIKSVDVLQTYVPEAMSSIDIDEYCFSQLPDLQNKTIGIGPGLGTEKQTAAAFHQLLKLVDSPMVIDADAINILSKNKSWIDLIPKNSILTPHPKEFKRLVGKWNNDFERLETQRSFSISHQLIIILKGAHTSISDTDGQIYFNSTGNSGMATAGSGDVLTGIITALLAQNYSPIHTAIIGVFLHGLAGDLALTHQSKESLIASDIINNLGNAYKHLEQNE